MKLYLAGPMTGIPQFNFPAFALWATALRSRGYMVVSPHEEDPEDVQQAAWASPDGDPSKLPSHDTSLVTALRNVEAIGQCDGLALLSDWHKSGGTIHEIATATRFRLPVAPAWLWRHCHPRTALQDFGLYG